MRSVCMNAIDMSAENNLRRRNISWRENIDVLAIKMAADDKVNVSEFLEKLVLTEWAKRQPHKGPESKDPTIMRLIQTEIKKAMTDLAERLEQSGHTDLEKAAHIVRRTKKKS